MVNYSDLDFFLNGSLLLGEMLFFVGIMRFYKATWGVFILLGIVRYYMEFNLAFPNNFMTDMSGVYFDTGYFSLFILIGIYALMTWKKYPFLPSYKEIIQSNVDVLDDTNYTDTIPIQGARNIDLVNDKRVWGIVLLATGYCFFYWGHFEGIVSVMEEIPKVVYIVGIILLAFRYWLGWVCMMFYYGYLVTLEFFLFNISYSLKDMKIMTLVYEVYIILLLLLTLYGGYLWIKSLRRKHSEKI